MRRTANAARRPTPSDASPRAAAPAAPPGARILPTAAEFLDPRGPYLVPLVLLLAFRIVAWQTIPLPAEDAFITFRYARNLATGNGLVYNPGDWVMGFSSPVWTLWISLGYALTHDAVLWARISGIVADVATLLVAGRMIVTAASPAAAWCFTFFFAAWPYFPALSVSGMEMSLLILAITLAAVLAVARHPAAGPSLALLALTRPEGLVAAAVIAFAATNRDRIVGLVLTGAGLAVLASRYGSPIPQSVLAKSHVYGLAGPWLGRHWWEWLSPIVMGRWPKVGDTAPLMVMTLVFAPALALGVRPLWAARRSALAIACAAGVTIWLGYAVLGVAYFWWYLAVPLTAATWIAAVGFPRLARGPALPAVVAAFVLSVHSLAYALYVGRSQEEQRYFGGAASYLAVHARPGEHVFLEPIGMVGYSAPVVVLDEVGLVTPRVAQRRMQGPGWYADVVTTERPEWIVVRAGVMRSGEAFAGAGAPFRDAAERDRVMAVYNIESRVGNGTDDATLVILRRRS
jgi:hypothetical protein